MSSVFFSIGTNLGDRASNLQNAIAFLDNNIGEVVAKSEVYESEPWGYSDDLQYYNMMVEVKTDFNPEITLEKCLAYESEQGRERSDDGKYISRVVDIDIVLWGNLQMRTDRLQIPHPRAHLRNFVMVPFAEIAPNVEHPTFGSTIEDLQVQCIDKCRVKKVGVTLGK